MMKFVAACLSLVLMTASASAQCKSCATATSSAQVLTLPQIHLQTQATQTTQTIQVPTLTTIQVPTVQTIQVPIAIQTFALQQYGVAVQEQRASQQRGLINVDRGGKRGGRVRQFGAINIAR